MGTSKTTSFAKRQNHLALLAKALAHPARITIIQFLLEKQSCHCGGLVEELPLSQSTISQHLKVLKSAGLVKGEVEGSRVCYCIDKEVWEEARTAFLAFISPEVSVNKCC